MGCVWQPLKDIITIKKKNVVKSLYGADVEVLCHLRHWKLAEIVSAGSEEAIALFLTFASTSYWNLYPW